jgi:hypothetical protein
MKRSSAPFSLLAPALAAALAVALAGTAWASPANGTAVSQPWQWRDGNGRMVYSDVPPPPSMPAASIVHAPDRFAAAYRPAEQAVPTSPATPDMAPARTAAQPASAPSAEAAFRERREARRKSEAEQNERLQADADRQARCAAMRNYAAALQQGTRTAVAGADGSVRQLDADQRQGQLQKIAEDLAKHCA